MYFPDLMRISWYFEKIGWACWVCWVFMLPSGLLQCMGHGWGLVFGSLFPRWFGLVCSGPWHLLQQRWTLPWLWCQENDMWRAPDLTDGFLTTSKWQMPYGHYRQSVAKKFAQMSAWISSLATSMASCLLQTAVLLVDRIWTNHLQASCNFRANFTPLKTDMTVENPMLSRKYIYIF